VEEDLPAAGNPVRRVERALAAEAVELGRESSLLRDLEHDDGRLEPAALGSPRQGLVADDLQRLQLDDRLVGAVDAPLADDLRDLLAPRATPLFVASFRAGARLLHSTVDEPLEAVEGILEEEGEADARLEPRDDAPELLGLGEAPETDLDVV